jgi:hypothetical protein
MVKYLMKRKHMKQMMRKNKMKPFKKPKKLYYFSRAENNNALHYTPKHERKFITIRKTPLLWKDKYETPRVEHVPSFHIIFLGLQLSICWVSPAKNIDTHLYYEMYLWYKHYSDKDIDKAKETWPWVDGTTKKSTWDENALIQNNG